MIYKTIISAALITSTVIGCGNETQTKNKLEINKFQTVSDKQSPRLFDAKKMSISEMESAYNAHTNAIETAWGQIVKWNAEEIELKSKLREDEQYSHANVRNNTMQVAAKIMDIRAQMIALIKTCKWRVNELNNINAELIQRGQNIPGGLEKFKDFSADIDEKLVWAEQAYVTMKGAFQSMQGADAKLNSGYNARLEGSEANRFSAEQIMLQSRASERAANEALARLPADAPLMRQQLETERRMYHETAEFAARQAAPR